nr:hypothetical protein [Tanacetum cinerariifolium]
MLHEDLPYAMLHEMVMKKFNLEAINPLNLSAKVSSIEDNFDITDDHEVRFFVECASQDELAHLYVSQHRTFYDTTTFLENHQENMFYNFFEPKNLENIRSSNNITNTSFENNGLDLNIETSHFHNNESNHQNESHFEKPECTFAFGDYHEYEDEKNKFDDVVDEKPLSNFQKWQKYMSFKPDIPETPLYKSKPMVSKDYKKETHVKGTNLIVVGMDGNNQIDPIAFGICKGETDPCWSWHVAIALAAQYEFPLSYHAVCCRHLMMNLSLKRDKRKALFWRICKAYTTEDFSRSMSHLQDIQTNAYDKLCQVSPQRWSRAHCPLVRYNYLTSNSVESVNACTVVYRKLLVLKLAETYRTIVREWYYQRRKLTDFVDMIIYLTRKISRRFTTLYYMLPPNNALLGLKQIKNGYDTNVMYDIARIAGKIQLFISHHRIDLSTVLIPNDGSLEEALEGACQCRKSQLSGIPCGHVISVTRYLGLSDCQQFVSDWFKKPKYQGTYAEPIHFIGNVQEWEFPQHIRKAIPPMMDNPQPGRPKNTN